MNDMFTINLIVLEICNLIGLIIILFVYLIVKLIKEIKNYKRMSKTLNCCLLEVDKKPYITFKIIKKSYIKRYINLGIEVKEEGIADILMGDKCLNRIERELEGMAIVIKSLYKYNIKVSFI
jgi:hypothetical protein